MTEEKTEAVMDTEKVFMRGFITGLGTAIVLGLIALGLTNRRTW